MTDGVVIVSFCFFFQAEDGIRDLVRSRGLGDVYKRQAFDGVAVMAFEHVRIDALPCRNANLLADEVDARNSLGNGMLDLDAVSYTHLTLPTSDLV